MKKPEKEEFLDILDRYQGILHKVNLIYFHNSADREDNFQEMVYQLWKSFPQLKNKASIGSWIYKVAINTSIVKFKKDQKTSFSSELPDVFSETDIEEQIGKGEDAAMLIRAIRELNEIDRAIMFLYLEEKSYEEIAGIIGITAGNVGVRISRAKKVLKKRLKDLSYGK
jgi:RNA polymerase sigma-70 factor (ECF subfamily)